MEFRICLGLFRKKSIEYPTSEVENVLHKQVFCVYFHKLIQIIKL